MMVLYDVPLVDLPILELFKAREWFGKLVPGSLWIIGANGRLDLFGADWSFSDRGPIRKFCTAGMDDLPALRPSKSARTR